MIVSDLSFVALSESGALRRAAPRPAPERQDGYELLFDDKTVIYDLFDSANDDGLVAIAPPFFNLNPTVCPITASAAGTPAKLLIAERSLYARITIWPTMRANEIVLGGIFGEFRLPVNQNKSFWFKDRRVLLTVSKDNDLRWVEDWVRFNVKQHRADAVLVYDNGSTAYPIGALEETLRRVPGIEVAAVVSWPFKWGPSGINNRWDSNFAQIGAIQHARFRFLRLARSVLNSDIDELCLTANRTSVFDEVEQSDTGYIRFLGRWIENVCADSSLQWENRRHRNFYCFVAGDGYNCPTKWAIVPSRLPEDCSWEFHSVAGVRESPLERNFVSYRHFRAINTGWKYSRDRMVQFSGDLHRADQPLVDAFEDTFRE